MNKLLMKVAGIALGLSLATGIGVAVGGRQAKAAEAATNTYNKITTLTAGDEVLIVATKSSTNYVLSAADTSSSPSASITATVSNNSIIADLDANLFTVGGSSDEWTFQNSSDSYLYTTNSNTGVRVGGTNHNWSLESKTNGYALKDNSTNRYIGVYQTSDWRSYTTSNQSNYGGSGEAINFYKKAAAKTLSSISVKTAPTKIIYFAGDYFNPAGLELTATYSDSSAATIDYATFGSDFTFTPSTSTALTTSNVSITIGYGGKTTTQAITVNPARTLSSIAVTTAPTTTVYDEGDSFDSTGMVVTATYNDSSTDNVTSSCTFSPNPLTYGTTAVTIAFGGKTTTQAVTVNRVVSKTFTPGTDTGSTSVTKGGITVAMSTMDNADYYQIYANASGTFTAPTGRTIKTIEFSCTASGNSKYGPGNTSADVGNYSYSGFNGTWTGDAASVTLTSTAQVRMTTLTVTLNSTEPSVELNHALIDLKTNQASGLTVEATVHNVDAPIYSWVSNNNNVTLENDDTAIVTIKPNTNVEASSTVTLTVSGVTPNLTATVTVSITVPEPGETAETAYTVAEAIDSIDDVGEQSDVYVTGIISQIDSYNSTYHSITYWISDDGTTTDQFEVYSGKGLNGANFSSVDDLVVGSQVIVFGTIKLYSSTYEFGANSSIVSIIVPPQVNSISLTPSIVNVAPSATGNITALFTNIVINQDAGSNKTISDIVWSTDDASVFAISNNTYTVAGAHKTSTTIHASIGGKQYGSATVEVVDPNNPFIVYDVPVEWNLASSLSIGDVVAIVYESGDTHEQLTSVSSNVGQHTSYSTAGNPSTTYVYTVGEGNAANSYTFSDGTNYLAYTSASTSGNNNLHTISNPSTQDQLNQVSWTVSITDGEATVTNVYNTNRLLRYNTGSPRFCCYTSGQKAISFYKMTGGNESTLDLDNTILTLVRSHMSTYQDEHGDDQYGIAVCDYYRTTPLDKDDWDDIGADFTSSVIDTYKLNYARANAAGNDVEKFLSAYDYVVANYGADYDFLGRIATGKVTVNSSERAVSPLLDVENEATGATVTVITLTSVAAVGGFFFLRKRRLFK